LKLNRTQLKEDQTASLLPIEDYDFEVIGAEDKPNAKSSDGVMTKLVLAVTDEDGRRRKIKSVLGLWKNGGAKTMNSFFESTGLDPDEDHAPEDLIGLTGRLHNKHGEFNGTPQDEVGYYIPRVPGSGVIVKRTPVAPVEVDSDLPF
jgi:hypothetical protein